MKLKTVSTLGNSYQPVYEHVGYRTGISHTPIATRDNGGLINICSPRSSIIPSTRYVAGHRVVRCTKDLCPLGKRKIAPKNKMEQSQIEEQDHSGNSFHQSALRRHRNLGRANVNL
jgi:hypothetical protein